jgi:hypothetical protein
MLEKGYFVKLGYANLSGCQDHLFHHPVFVYVSSLPSLHQVVVNTVLLSSGGREKEEI